MNFFQFTTFLGLVLVPAATSECLFTSACCEGVDNTCGF